MTVPAAGAQGNTETAATTTTTVTPETPAATTVTTPATDPQPGDGAAAAAASAVKPGEETPAASAAAAATTVPEKYALVIPDDGKTYVDEFTVSSIEKLARESGWSNEDAQNALNEQVLSLKAADAHFLSQLKADPDYGGEKLAETQKLAKSAIDLIRPEGHPRREAFLRTINRVAGGNNPEFVSFLADLGKRAAEDSTGASSGASRAGEKTAEQVLYGNTPKT